LRFVSRAYWASSWIIFFASTAPPMDERSKSSVVAAMYQPRFSSPSRLERGTRTFSKKTSLKPWLFIMSMSGRVLMPGVFMSSRK
jgi:hypothetical protein